MSVKKNLHGFKEVLFEYNPQGRYISVCALDPITKMEATIIAPVETSLPALQNIATRKLKMVVDKHFPDKTQKKGDRPKSAYGKQQNISGWDL